MPNDSNDSREQTFELVDKHFKALHEEMELQNHSVEDLAAAVISSLSAMLSAAARSYAYGLTKEILLPEAAAVFAASILEPIVKHYCISIGIMQTDASRDQLRRLEQSVSKLKVH